MEDSTKSKVMYFDSCKTKEELKRNYHHFLFLYHPDYNNGIESKHYKPMQKEYFKMLKNFESNDTTSQKQQNPFSIIKNDVDKINKEILQPFTMTVFNIRNEIQQLKNLFDKL